MSNVEPQKEREELLVRQIEELVFETLYSPVDLSALLETADGRGRIRRVSPAHLYYGLQKLEDSEITTLLPHITQEQWTGVLDLDLWSKDEMSTGAFLHLEGFIAGADDPVARKLIRAADSELWSLLFKRRLQIHQRIEEDEFEGAPEEGEWLETPDRAFRLILPEDPEESRLLRALVSRLFGLDPELATILLLEAQARTSVELEEEGYQNHKRRIETAGFQDYFESFEIYSVLSRTTLFLKRSGNRSSSSPRCPPSGVARPRNNCFCFRPSHPSPTLPTINWSWRSSFSCATRCSRPIRHRRPIKNKSGHPSERRSPGSTLDSTGGRRATSRKPQTG